MNHQYETNDSSHKHGDQVNDANSSEEKKGPDNGQDSKYLNYISYNLPFSLFPYNFGKEEGEEDVK